MRFQKLVYSSLAVLALGSISFNGIAHAEEDTTVSSTDNPLTADSLANPEKIEFQAEVSRVLDIVVNSLYTNKDVFLRELISNASDALDKIRFTSITDPNVLKDKEELEVRISFNAQESTLTITDSGVGMTKEELVKNLGTVAMSGTTKFMEALDQGADVDQIGMFGVGFYSTFLVADKVTVASKSPDESTQYVWMSENGSSSFSVAEDPRGNTLGRGTEITLHLKDDAYGYANYDKLVKLVEHYSEFVAHPVYIRKTETSKVPIEDDDEDEFEEDGEDFDISEEEDADEEDDEPEKEVQFKEVTTQTWEKANADTAIWNRPKDDISDDEYQDFFKLITKNVYNASSWSHFDAEGNINFKSLIFMPHRVPQTLRSGDLSNVKSQMKLYVRKVLISDEFDLLPRYMSFVAGVVDSDDLPLNVNRETLQESKIISIIRKKVTRKVIDMMKKLADEPMPEPEETDDEDEEDEIDEDGNVIEKEPKSAEPVEHPYIKWYIKFAPSIKMGIMEDEPNQRRLAKLIRFKSSKSGDLLTSFEDYVNRMKDHQKEIYFIAGTEEDNLPKSAFMEKFNEKDIEVIYFTEPADEYMIQHLKEYDSKKFTSITNEHVTLETEDEKDEAERRHKAYKAKFKGFLKFMNKFYGTKVMSVSISKRLGSVPAIISSSAYGQSANMERIMRAQAFAHHQNKEMMMDGMRTMEINPRHPFIISLYEKIEINDEGETEDGDLPKLDQVTKDALWNILDTALLNGGFPVTEGKGFTNRMMRTIKNQLSVDSTALIPEIEVPLEEDVPPEGGNGDEL